MKLMKAGKIITLILTAVNALSAVLFLGMVVFSFIAPEKAANGPFLVSGVQITPHILRAAHPAAPLALVFLTGAAMACIMAVMFQRMYRVITCAMEGMPFQPCTVKWMRQIGLCAVAQPLLALAMGVVAQLLPATQDSIHVTPDVSGLLNGILMLCLTHVFAYGLELQHDADGLL